MNFPYGLTALERRERELQAPLVEKRIRHRLPEQLELARRKVRALENQARRLGMTNLLEVNDA